MRLPKLTLRDLFWLVLVIALLTDRVRLISHNNAADRRASYLNDIVHRSQAQFNRLADMQLKLIELDRLHLRSVSQSRTSEEAEQVGERLGGIQQVIVDEIGTHNWLRRRMAHIDSNLEDG